MKRYKSALISFIVSFGLCVTFHNGFAQTTWEQLFYDWDNEVSDLNITGIDLKYDSINDHYIFLGLNHSANGGISVYELSGNGNLLSRNYYYSGGGGGQNLQFTKEGGAIMFDIGDDSGKVIPELFRLDTSYNTILWKYEYAITISAGSGLKETTDHKLLMAGTTNNGNPYILKLDSMGDILNFYVYNGIYAYMEFVTQTSDGNYIVGANSYQGKGAELFKTDTSGNVLWSKSYLRPNGYVYDIVEKENGNSIIIGTTDISAQTPIPVMFISELDTAGNTVWCKSYGDSVNNLTDYSGTDDYLIPMTIKPTFDGGYIITASIKVPSNTSLELVLLKIDSVGNIQWERRHGGYPSTELGINLIQTPDKGYFVVGSFAWNGQGYYVLKTDSLGFTSCSGFSDSIAQNTINAGDSSIVVTDSAIAINVYPGYVYAKTNSAPYVDDGCLLDGLTENSINENGLLVYPNPTSGKFHLTVSDAAFKEKDIYIYDVLGKQVYNNVKTTVSDFDIDLSANAKGIYFVKVVSQGKVFMSRIVLM